MVQYSAAALDASFAALGDSTRRGVLERLGRAEASMSTLAQAFGMTLTGMRKHVDVLERAGLVVTEKVGRVRTCRLGARGLDAEAAWIETHRRLWEERFTALDAVVEELNAEEKRHGSRADGHGGGMTRTKVERASDRELVVTRTFRGPAALVFEAWTRPELFRRWWAPKSFGVSIVSFDADVRTGGGYRLVMAHPSSDKPMEFFGRYIEVTPPSRLVWTNEEGEADGPVTTVTFEDRDGGTLVTLRDLHPSREALDEAIESGSTSGWGEQLEQLDELLSASPAEAGAA